VTGSGKYINATRPITRAEFLALLSRVLPDHMSAPDGARYNGAVFTDDTVLEDAEVDDVYFSGAASDISLTGVTAKRVTILSDELKSLELSGTAIERLTLAFKNGELTLSPKSDSPVKTAVIGGGDGSVHISGAVSNVEITGDNREISLGGELDSVVVSGGKAVITIESGATVRELRFLPGSEGGTVTVLGRVERAVVAARNIKLKNGGKGSLGVLEKRDIYWNDAQTDMTPDETVDKRDFGLRDAVITLTAPESLRVGETLRVYASIQNVAPGRAYEGAWSVDGVAAGTFLYTVESGTAPELSRKFTYTQNMAKTAKIALTLKCADDKGATSERRVDTTVKLENYSDLYYSMFDPARVLSLVTTGYQGNFTTAWALAHDYQAFEKEIWVNAKGFTSGTPYLLWVNLTYQRLNIFKYDYTAAKWKLIRVCLVGTGAPRNGTPVGVWKTTVKQKTGWTTSSYTVKPVVRFKGGGYAFHSRLYYPNTNKLSDASIGYPISHGCVRMLDEDIQYVFDTIPDGTTTVVF
jgi:hypothetical protein